ncbi:hypothetical protein ACIBSW_16215 [Actinoplanes sp. NPDC049668]|uniref:hypothetical protein n=1 Tax=unclassified Actinoplanes TaxID=2626549 RepID=UPI0033AE71E2
MTARRSLGPGDVAAPAPDAALFRSSTVRALLILVAATVAAWVCAKLLISALIGHGVSWEDVGPSLLVPVVGALTFFGATAWRQRGRPTWIRVSGLGIELAQCGDPVFVPWSQITAAGVRGRWIFSALEITPADLYAVRSALPSRDLPAIRYRRGVAMFRVDVGAIRPGRSELRLTLDRHRPAALGPQPASPQG